MSKPITLTISRGAVVAAVDSILDITLRDEFTACRNLDTLITECGGGCEADIEFLRAARNAGISIEERLAHVRHLDR